jgi:hypothetical protein
MDPDKLELMGLEDQGKWMPFTFHMDIVIACKLTSDEEDMNIVNCTTIFTDGGDAYIIDTPYKEFHQMFKDYHNPVAASTEEADL